jgi:hypothetical protein
MKRYLLLLPFLLVLLPACQGEEEVKTKAVASTESVPVQPEFKGCQTCHPSIRNDADHTFPCRDCHLGNESGRTKETAHKGLVAKPAHPDFMEKRCGTCHTEKVQSCRSSLHFSLRNKVRIIREHFGAAGSITELTDIASSPQPTTPTELVDDMLRRRCLRCHLYSSGDTYANTQRGTGCAACHMGFSNGELMSHEMIGQPGDLQCLGCHYANFVGADYYGRYEHDFGSEYRTPFTTRQEYFRPYGVEYHELVPDIHQQRGLACIDCHTGHQTSVHIENSITCKTCHQLSPEKMADSAFPVNIKLKGQEPLLVARLSGKLHQIPQMSHPAHKKYGDRVSCQVCHGQWSFNDSTTHLLRSDSDDYDPWAGQLVQSSSSVENLLLHNLTTDGEELPPAMSDSITGKMIPGVWYKGFTERRWERMVVAADTDGIIKVFRPILDLRLSYIDYDENVVFDNIEGAGKVLLPYTPHTTGKAGLFYLDRFSHLMPPPTSSK